MPTPIQVPHQKKTLGELRDFVQRGVMAQKEADELCRRAGWPTITEQQKHWREQDEAILAAFQAVRDTVKNLMEAVDGLQKICQLQQEQIDKLKQS